MTRGATISQEAPPESFESDQKEYLARRFIDISTALDDAQHANPPRKQMPYKPQVGHVYYFGDPATHNYDPVIDNEGWWGYVDYGTGGRWVQLNAGLTDIEVGALTLTTPASFASGQTIAPYDGTSPLDPDQLMVEDPIAGTITIGVTGFYEYNGYVVGTGSQNNDYYGAYIVSSLGGQYLLGATQWDQNNPGMVFSGGSVAYLTAGEVISMTAWSNGVATLDVVRATLIVKLQRVAVAPTAKNEFFYFHNLFSDGYWPANIPPPPP